MPAKAMVSVEAFPCIHRFRGHGPLLQFPHRRRRSLRTNMRPHCRQLHRERATPILLPLSCPRSMPGRRCIELASTPCPTSMIGD